MTDRGDKIELTTIHYLNSYKEEGNRDTAYFFGNVILRKKEIIGIEEDVLGFHEHCFLLCNVLLKNGDSILVKENYYELSEMFNTFS